ncbi:hypothetical protein OIU78_015943 [Salix suchowensis]|nr:hypothetical protein OIU78_015943 [Salix suchowensis]
MAMHMVIDLGDLLWDMGAAEVLFQVRIHMGCIVAVRVWVMEVLTEAVKVECTDQATVVITCLVAVMLAVALTRQCTQVVAWAALTTRVLVAQDHTINI